MRTLGELKYALIKGGISIAQEDRQAPAIQCGMMAFQPGEEIALELAENFIVKIPLEENKVGLPQLKSIDGKTRLFLNDAEFDIAVIPHPGFIRSQEPRSPMSDNICMDGFCLNFFLRALGQKLRLNLEPDSVLEIIRSAFNQGCADLIQLNMDFSKDPNRAFKSLVPLVEAIKKNYSAFVALKALPPKDLHALDKMYACGIDILNLPLGGFAGAATISEETPFEQILKALEYASGVFPQGAVWTELALAGKTELLKNAISDIAAKGVIPLLKLQPPSIAQADDYLKVQEVARHLGDVAAKNKLNLKWLYPNSRYMTPLDYGFYVEGSPAQITIKPLYMSTLGKKTSEGFAAFRRKLRIRDISDSFESAGL
ncbi:MAG: hypothetical protein G3M78_04940 [Candidatus Nitrohelix vancouverensis]|uniref:Uncharacterized protein n=1 Tax=Candidatus Nitrohelix vancouverensis TaxID=2705534 RepID=A0A7T0C1H1_9BACT|nr:MAG: hypothetical protein G3M78_04940 [Candidatus Nitrohelix vancouverensis]